MRLFLFSASLFFLLGLKLASTIEIRPFFNQQPPQTEHSGSSSAKESLPDEKTEAGQSKKVQINQVPRSGCPRGIKKEG